MAQDRNGFSAWLHTFPTLRWIPSAAAARGRRRLPSIRSAYHHPVETGVVAGVRATGGFVRFLIVMATWMLALGLWTFEIEIWATVWAYYGAFVVGRWIYRRNVVGQTVRGVFRRGGTGVSTRPLAASGGPVDLAALGDTYDAALSDPYETERARSRG